MGRDGTEGLEGGLKCTLGERERVCVCACACVCQCKREGHTVIETTRARAWARDKLGRKCPSHFYCIPGAGLADGGPRTSLTSPASLCLHGPSRPQGPAHKAEGTAQLRDTCSNLGEQGWCPDLGSGRECFRGWRDKPRTPPGCFFHAHSPVWVFLADSVLSLIRGPSLLLPHGRIIL